MAQSLKQQLERIAKNLQPQIEQIMREDVAEEVIELGKDNVQTVVYDAYNSPAKFPYQRTGKLKEDWEKQNVPNGVIVRNTRNDNSRNVASIVETGVGYSIKDKWGYGYEEPRPFIKTTKEQIESSKLVENVLKSKLKGVR